ncbi:uncharacterized protein [Physcomitrium patens]|uniref:uncharacterized protein n=1 Tax=Physcomitrium patens TaxID=3218 RepID=UPI00024AC3E9
MEPSGEAFMGLGFFRRLHALLPTASGIVSTATAKSIAVLCLACSFRDHGGARVDHDDVDDGLIDDVDGDVDDIADIDVAEDVEWDVDPSAVSFGRCSRMKWGCCT